MMYLVVLYRTHSPKYVRDPVCVRWCVRWCARVCALVRERECVCARALCECACVRACVCLQRCGCVPLYMGVLMCGSICEM